MVAPRGAPLLAAIVLGLSACHFTLADNPGPYSCAGDSLCPPGETCGRDQLCHADDAGVDAGVGGGCALACASGERCVQGSCACDPVTCTGSLSCNGANHCIQGSCASGGTDCRGSSECCSAVCNQQCVGCGHVGASCTGSGGGGGGCCVGLGCDGTQHCALCQGEGAPCNNPSDCCLNVCTGGLCASRELCDSNCNGCSGGNCVCPLGDRCSSTSSCRSLGWHGSCQ